MAGDFLHEFTADELEVAETLLNLPHLLARSPPRFQFTFGYGWGSKRPRTSLRPDPPGPGPELAPVGPGPEERESDVRKADAPASSPATPLSFCPSDSDLPPLKRKKPSVKRTKEELERIIKKKLEAQALYLEEINRTKLYLESLKVINSQLKAQRHQYLRLGQETGEPKEEAFNELKLESGTKEERENAAVNDQVHAGPSTSTASRHCQPLISCELPLNPTAQNVTRPEPEPEPEPRWALDLDLNALPAHDEPDGPAAVECSQPSDRVGLPLAVCYPPLDSMMYGQMVMGMQAQQRAAAQRSARQKRIELNKFKRSTRVR